MNICVFGAASTEIDELYIKKVEELGERMANRSHNLVFGAGNGGLMGAAARGTKKGGGKVFGFIPSFFKEEIVEPIFDSCDEITFTDNMAERKAGMENLADAFIIVPGGIGTFEEFFQVLTLKQLGRHTKPIVIYDIDGYYDILEEFLDFSIKKKFIKSTVKEIFGHGTTADEVIDIVENDKRISRDVHDLKIG